jgi:hypothetical protein
MYLHLPKELPAWKAIGWLSLGAFLLEATPGWGCVCANGEFRVFCPRIVFGRDCTCCSGREPLGNRACCANSQRMPSSRRQGDAIRLPRCCHPAIAGMRTTTNKESESSYRDVSNFDWENSLATVAPSPASLGRIPLRNRKPPADLVIALCRLTI